MTSFLKNRHQASTVKPTWPVCTFVEVACLKKDKLHVQPELLSELAIRTPLSSVAPIHESQDAPMAHRKFLPLKLRVKSSVSHSVDSRFPNAFLLCFLECCFQGRGTSD